MEKLLSEEQEPQPAAPAPRHDASDRAATARPAFKPAPMLQDILAACRSMPPGLVNLICLDSLRERLGSRWPALEDKVHSVLERMLRQQLSDREIFARHSATEYIVVSTTLSPEAAQLRCLKLTEALHHHFLGDGNTGRIVIKSGLRAGEGGQAFEELSVETLVARRRAAQEAAAAAHRAPIPRLVAEEDDIRIAPQLRPSPSDDPEAEAGLALRTSFAGAARDGVDEVDAAQRSASEAPEADSGPLAEDIAEPEDDVFSNPALPIPRFVEDEQPPTRVTDFLYAPFWDLKTQVLSTYFCISKRTLQNQVAQDGLSVSSGEDWLDRARIDLETLRHVLFVLNNLLTNGVRSVMALPVHYETLATARWRRVYVGFALTIPRRIRQHLTLELCGLPAGITPGRLLDIVSILKPFSRALLVRLPPDSRDLAAYCGLGAHAIGLDLDFVVGGDEEIEVLMERLAKEAERKQLWTYLHNARKPGVVLAAAAAGIRYVDGESVGGLADTPRQFQRYTWDDLVARIKQPA
jgi:hypothetical protein